MSVLFLRKPGVIQQPGPISIAPYWLRRGLQMVVDNGVVVFNRENRAPAARTITGGPKSQPSKFGQVKGFGTTYGTGTTDRIDSGTLAPPSTSKRSIVAQLYPKTTGGGGLGRVYQDMTGSGSAAGEALWITSTTGITYSIRISASAATAQWVPASPLTLDRWQVLGFSVHYIGSGSTGYAYIDGKLVASTVGGIAGSLPGTNPATNLTFGNRVGDGARGWDGMIGLILIFDGFLEAKDHLALAANPRQVFSTHQALWVGALGSGILNAGVLESLSASDLSDGMLSLSVAIAETVSVLSDVGAVSNVTRPNSDVLTAGWVASTGTDLYAMIDETAASDTDYITSPDLTSGASTTIHGLSQPLATGTYTVRFRSEKATAPARSVRVHFMNSSSTVVGSSSWQALTTSYATYELSITTSGLATRVGIEAQ